MRDWDALVRERLGSLGVTRAQRDEIVAEIAGHLQDSCEERRADGMPESEAVERALSEVTNWPRLAGQIRRARYKEENMNERTRRFWLPGFVTLFASTGSLLVLQQASARSGVPSLRGALWPLPYAVWLVLQPLWGFLGAYMSRRGGGERGARLAASLFPSGVMLVLWGVVLVTSILIEKNQYVIRHPMHFGLGAIASSIFLGLTLLAGALPFLRAPKLTDLGRT